jgi:ubiquitin-like protein Pup
MSKHTHAQAQKHEDDAPAEPLPVATNPETAARKAKLDDSIDAILDEIDDLLAVNAKEFVDNFRQQGGQ